MSDGELVVKLVISVIAIVKMVIPEPASTVAGIAVLAGVWGLDWSPSEES